MVKSLPTTIQLILVTQSLSLSLSVCLSTGSTVHAGPWPRSGYYSSTEVYKFSRSLGPTPELYKYAAEWCHAASSILRTHRY
jgi:hypothetical protein